uniref:Ig-like domain-containing protein n=1 Tax=Anabas testudineus TaxID=64144 RepID=A0A3Q1H0D7_ANATE
GLNFHYSCFSFHFLNLVFSSRCSEGAVCVSESTNSVTLTCSSDANPAANYTWYKGNQTIHHGPEGIYHFTSISSADTGTYFCKSENQYGDKISSTSINDDLLFLCPPDRPNLPSVSLSPSEIVEGSSVTLTCSSDANPAANYTWYKENEESPKASGPIFTITDIRHEHSGNYYCEAWNTRGRHNSTLSVIRLSGKCLITSILTFYVFDVVTLWSKPFTTLLISPLPRSMEIKSGWNKHCCCPGLHSPLCLYTDEVSSSRSSRSSRSSSSSSSSSMLH